VSKDVRCAEPRMAARTSARISRARACSSARETASSSMSSTSRTRRPCCRAPDRRRSGDAVERRPSHRERSGHRDTGFEWRHPRTFAICVPRRNDEASTCPAPIGKMNVRHGICNV
jgi:hypothetical protein